MNRQFPALRGIAIFLVVINHSIVLSLITASDMGLPKPGDFETFILLAIKEIGVLAVPAFLFLAGSFMVYGLREKNLNQSYSLILPVLQNAVLPYLIWSGVFYLVAYGINNETFSALGYLKNLIIGYPFNFVPILVFFIILSPILVKAARRYPWLVMLIFAFLQVFLVSLLQPGILGITLPQWMQVLSPPVLRLPLALWAVFYPFGIVYSLHNKAVERFVAKIIWLVMVLAAALYIVSILHENGHFYFPLAEWAFPIVVILLFPFIKRSRIPLTRKFEELGKRSYGLYLTNLTILMALTFAAGKLIPAIYEWTSLLVILVASLTLTLPVMFMRWFEKRFGRNMYRIVFG